MFSFVSVCFFFVGDLLVILASERTWWPRRVTVRAGQLLVSSGPGEGAPPSLRIPLRQLSLRAGRLPNSLALCKGQNVLLTLQVKHCALSLKNKQQKQLNDEFFVLLSLNLVLPVLSLYSIQSELELGIIKVMCEISLQSPAIVFSTESHYYAKRLLVAESSARR